MAARNAHAADPASSSSKPSSLKTVSVVTLYGASAVSVIGSGFFGWKSLAARNEADTEAQLAPVGFCANLVTPMCAHYVDLREEQNVFALRAWGLLGLSTVFAFSGLAVGEIWPNERLPLVAISPSATGAEVTLALRLDL